jgi:hypothetical protein
MRYRCLVMAQTRGQTSTSPSKAEAAKREVQDEEENEVCTKTKGYKQKRRSEGSAV